jgi:hypothetical protein
LSPPAALGLPELLQAEAASATADAMTTALAMERFTPASSDFPACPVLVQLLV